MDGKGVIQYAKQNKGCDLLYVSHCFVDRITWWITLWSSMLPCQRRYLKLGKDVILHAMMDGTFSSAPQVWQQFFSVHDLFDSGWHLPFVYVLIPGKTDFLSELYTSPVWRWFKTIGSLLFMEPGSVVDVWRHKFFDNLPTEMNEFASYFERTWISTPTPEPIFDK
jgi:hypothetical protein